jgi:hypothetical protein
MYTFLLLFINNHIQQRFRIERMFFFWKIVLLPLRFQYWFHRRSNICSLFHKIISKVVSTLFTPYAQVVRMLKQMKEKFTTSRLTYNFDNIQHSMSISKLRSRSVVSFIWRWLRLKLQVTVCLTTCAYGVNTSLQLMRCYRACIFSLYFLDRGLFFTLIVTD